MSSLCIKHYNLFHFKFRSTHDESCRSHFIENLSGKKILLQMSWAGENILDALPSKDRASSIEEFAKGRFCHISFGVWVAPTCYRQ
jgi:hypothetical protein